MVAFYMIFFFILFIVVYVGVPYVTYDFPEPAIGVILFVSLAVPIILFIFGSLDDNNSQMIISGLAIFLMGMVSIMGILFKHPKIIANIRGSLTK
jgi:amino acid transporter